MMPDCSRFRLLSVGFGEAMSANRRLAAMARKTNRFLAGMSVFMGYAFDVSNVQLTVGGPSATSGLPSDEAGPPFGEAPR